MSHRRHSWQLQVAQRALRRKQNFPFPSCQTEHAAIPDTEPSRRASHRDNPAAVSRPCLVTGRGRSESYDETTTTTRRRPRERGVGTSGAWF